MHTRVAGKFRHQVVNESEGQRHGCRSMRWKSALSEILEPDTLDAVSSSHSNVSTWYIVVVILNISLTLTLDKIDEVQEGEDSEFYNSSHF